MPVLAYGMSTYVGIMQGSRYAARLEEKYGLDGMFMRRASWMQPRRRTACCCTACARLRGSCSAATACCSRHPPAQQQMRSLAARGPSSRGAA